MINVVLSITHYFQFLRDPKIRFQKFHQEVFKVQIFPGAVFLKSTEKYIVLIFWEIFKCYRSKKKIKNIT